MSGIDAGAWLRAIADLSPAELARIHREAREQVEFQNAAAMERVRRDVAAKVRPQVVYRCARGCLLLTAWKHPRTVIISHRGVRVAARRLEGKSAIGAAAITPGARLPELAQGDGAFVCPPRAYPWTPGDGIFIVCNHQYGTLGAPFGSVLEAQIDIALKLRSTYQLRVPLLETAAQED